MDVRDVTLKRSIVRACYGKITIESASTINISSTFAFCSRQKGIVREMTK